MKIKVQVFGGVSVRSAIESGFDDTTKLPLTFIAYSDTMKAMALENFVRSSALIGLSIYDGPNRNGEWHEKPVESNIYNI